MFDKYKRKDPSEEDPQEEMDLEPEESSYWEEDFDEVDSPELSVEELGDTFPIDEAFFASEGEFQRVSTDTSVIPPGVTDLSAYTAGGTPIGSEEPMEAEALYDLEEDEDDEDYDDYDDERHRVVRLRRRRRTGLLGGLMYAAFVLGLSIILAFSLWMVVDDVLGLTREEIPVEVTIPDNFTLEDVAEALYASGAISRPTLFTWYAEIFGAANRIQPGVYHVRPADYRAIINSLNQRTGEMIEVRVMIPEGRTVRQTFEILEEAGVATVEALEHIANTVSFAEFEFLEDLPMTTMNRLEGYLFPDTYIFFRRQSPESVIRRMLTNFETRMQNNEVFDLVEASPFTLHEILNIASMIERETASIAEMPRISSVIWNRIDRGMHLGIDATIQYLLPEPMEFLPRTLITELRDSPYNTYYHLGLPYGPIANPGVAAILAALQPERTNFLFYALHVDGDRHHFTLNYAEHQAFLRTPAFAHHPDNR